MHARCCMHAFMHVHIYNLHTCMCNMHLCMYCAGGVLGYAQQVTKCCNCSGFIEVLDASNQVMYTIQGEPRSLLADFSVCLSLECAEKSKSACAAYLCCYLPDLQPSSCVCYSQRQATNLHAHHHRLRLASVASAPCPCCSTSTCREGHGK